MKTTLKRFFNIALSLCIIVSTVFSLMSMTASAEEVTTNIVLGTTANRVLANGTAGANPAVQAFDGKPTDGNKWMAGGAQSATAWLIIDLGDTYDITKAVTIASTGRDPFTRRYYYDIYVANEGDFDAVFNSDNKTEIFEDIKANGTKAASVNSTNAQIGGTTSTFDVTGRYVLLHFVGCNDSDTVSLFEFEIYVKGDYSQNMPSSLIVTCYGDSVTEGYGAGSTDKAYPARLQELLGSGYLVQNCGDGGERAADIMARQGSMRIFTENEITFAAGQTQVLLGDQYRGFVCNDGRTTRKLQWTSPFGRDLPIQKVIIDGKTYTINITDYKTSLDCKTYLVRSDATEAVTIPANTEAFLQDITTVSPNNHCDIYLMGFNGVYEDIDHLVSLYQQAIAYGGENYIIIIPYMDLDQNYNKVAFKNSKEMREKFMAAFGDHAIDLVDYFANGGMEKAGFTPTEADLADLASGTVPVEYRAANEKGDVHLDANGYRILAGAVYDKGVELGYFTKNTSGDNTSSDSTSSDNTSSDEEEPPYAGDMSNTAPFVAVAFLSVLALAVTTIKVLKKD